MKKNIKIKLFFITFFSLALHPIVIAKPLTIINATTSPIKVEIFAKSYNKPIKTTIFPGSKQEYDMQNIIFERMVWETYGKKEAVDAFLLKKYSIDVQEKAPTMANGGSMVLSLGGEYMCDDKSGKRNAVKFGIGDKFDNGTEKEQGNED